MKKLQTGCFLLALLLLSACGPSCVEVPKQRSRLIGDIESYSSVEEARALLRESGPWEVLADEGKPRPGDSKPPHLVYNALVHNYQCEGFHGSVQLQFVNDRLMSTLFYPNDVDGFRKHIEAKFPGVVWQKPVKLPPFTLLRSGYDHYLEKYYVGWEDTRLIEEELIWIGRYA